MIANRFHSYILIDFQLWLLFLLLFTVLSHRKRHRSNRRSSTGNPRNLTEKALPAVSLYSFRLVLPH